MNDLIKRAKALLKASNDSESLDTGDALDLLRAVAEYKPAKPAHHVHFLDGESDGSPFTSDGPVCRGASYGTGTRDRSRVGCSECLAVLDARDLHADQVFDFAAGDVPRVALRMLVLREFAESAPEPGVQAESIASEVQNFAESHKLCGREPDLLLVDVCTRIAKQLERL